MKTILIFVAAITLYSSSAMAQDCAIGCGGNGGTGGTASQTQSTSSLATTGASTATNDGNSQNLVVNEATQLRAPVNTAYAAPLSIGGGVCAYSSFSAGGSVVGFSTSASKASMDEGCQDRADADLLARLGYQRQAAEILKTHPRVAAAFKAVQMADKAQEDAQVRMDQNDAMISSKPIQVQPPQADIPRKDGTPVKGIILPIPN